MFWGRTVVVTSQVEHYGHTYKNTASYEERLIISEKVKAQIFTKGITRREIVESETRL